MDKKTFLSSGHIPTLISAFLYFDISFMIWVLLAPLAPAARDQIKWGDAEHGLLLAVAPLGGAILRIVLGVLADSIGCKRTGLDVLDRKKRVCGRVQDAFKLGLDAEDRFPMPGFLLVPMRSGRNLIGDDPT